LKRQNIHEKNIMTSTSVTLEWSALGLFWGTLSGLAFAMFFVAAKALGPTFLAEFGLLILAIGLGTGLVLGALGLIVGAFLSAKMRARERLLD
jgi:hypothetical protein